MSRCNTRLRASGTWRYYSITLVTVPEENRDTAELSHGALIALHFALSGKTKDALRNPKTKEHCKPRVYALGPDRLKDCLNRSSENNRHAKENWEKYIEKHLSF